jgi:predicted N-formylglutamate amidohydrolase
MLPVIAQNHQSPVTLLNADGRGDVVLMCEHASFHIPDEYQRLGLSDLDAHSHAAWDPGALVVAQYLAAELDAPLICGAISRLVYDCNRPPSAVSAMPETSELIQIPGNSGLSAADRADRTAAVYLPFCDAVDATLNPRAARGQATVLVTIHSFTPVYFGVQRAVEIGILHDSDSRLADAMLVEAHRLPHRLVQRNEPYGPQDGVTHCRAVCQT